MPVSDENFKSALEVAKRIFEGTKYQTSDGEIERLAQNMVLLGKRGLNF